MNPDRLNKVAHARHGWVAKFAGLLLAMAMPGIALAQTSVTNRASVTPPTGVINSGNACTNPLVFDPATGSCTAASTITVTPAAAVVNFCPAGGPMPIYSITNGVSIHRFLPGQPTQVVAELGQTIGGTLNALMIDPIKNRLLFHSSQDGALWAYDAANGGWYVAANQSGSFPRGGMAPNGKGYLIQGGSNTPLVYEVEADAVGFGYTITSLGQLSYSHTPTGTNAGDIAFDADNIGWITTGADLYRVDFSLPGNPVAVRQTRPVMPGNAATPDWAGVAFDSDGNLIMTALNGTSYSYSFATGNLTSTSRATPSGTDSRDLASCAFPTPASATLAPVVKTLALVNGVAYVPGASVQPGDVLTYEILIGNTGGAATTLYQGDIVETLPTGATVVTAGNDFTCTGSNCPNTNAVNLPAGGSVTLRFVVQVDNPLPGGTTQVHNAVTVRDVDCAATGNTCTVDTPIGPFVTIEKTAPATVSAGADFNYTLTLTNNGRQPTTGAVIVVQDQLPAGVAAKAVTSAVAVGCGTLPSGTGVMLTCNVPGPLAVGASVSFDLTVTAPATAGDITNYAATHPDGDGNLPGTPPGPPAGSPPGTACVANATTSCDNATTTVQTATVTYRKTATPPANVVAGQAISYTLEVIVASMPTTADVVLTDVLGTGLTFGSVTSAGVFTADVTGAPTLVFTLPAGTGVGTYPVTYTATVNASATGSVANAATGTGGDNPACAGDPATVCATDTPLTPIASYNFCPADGSFFNIVNGVQFLRFTPPNGPAASIPELGLVRDGNVNALMVDPTPGSNRLLFHRRGATAGTGTNGAVWAYDPTHPTSPGWYETGAVINADLPRAGMTQAGVGYLMTSVTAAPSVPTAQMYRIERNGAHGYSVTGQTTVTYDVRPSDTGSGDIAFDADGNGWLVAGSSLYKVDVAAGTATLQQGFTGGPGANYAGAAFGPDGRLYVVVNATGNYYAMDLATGVITLEGNSGIPSGGDRGRDLASCNFPAFTPPQLQVAKTLAQVNGVAATPGQVVRPGDTLRYEITVSHVGGSQGATLFAGDIVETLPPGTTVVAAGNDFTCTGTTCTNTNDTNVSVGGSATLNFVVQVDTPPPSSLTDIVNAVKLKDAVCTTTPAHCAETTNPLGPSVTYGKTATLPLDGAGQPKTTVAVGDTITYTLSVTVANSSTTDAVVLADTLGTGLTFGSVTVPGIFVADTSGSPLTFTLPANTAPGTYSVSYTATVNASATGTVTNAVLGTGGDNPSCSNPAGCGTNTPLTDSSVTYDKSVVLPAGQTTVTVNDTLTYTLSVTVANSSTTDAVVLADTLGTGLTFGSVTVPGIFVADTSGSPLTFTLPANTAPGTYSVSYTATVNASATGAVTNAVLGTGGDNPSCSNPAGCGTSTPLNTEVTYNKSVTLPAGQTTVAVNDTLTYTLSVVVANSSTTAAVVLSDTLGTGLTFGSVTVPGIFVADTSGSPLTFTLPANTAPGTYSVSYTATVNAAATGAVTNAVLGTGGDNPSCSNPAGCGTNTPLTDSAVTYDKSVTLPTGQTTVAVNDTLTYTLSVTVTNSSTTAAVVLSDTLGTGLTFGSVTVPGIFVADTSGSPLTFTLPANTAPGTYSVSYTATVNAAATGTVTNAVLGTGGDNPSCSNPAGCGTSTPLTDSAVTYSKSVTLPAGQTTVGVGDTLTYELSVVVTNSQTTDAVVLADTLGTGLTFGSVTVPGIFVADTSGSPLTFTLPANTAPGTYSVSYTATVDAAATGAVTNAVLGSGGDNPGCASAGGCGTSTPLDVAVSVVKSADPLSGQSVAANQTLTYTLAVTVANSATLSDVVLTDTLGTGLTFVGLGTTNDGFTLGGTGNTRTFTLPAGQAPGTYEVSYTATVDATATTSVGNSVTATGGGNPTDPTPPVPTCTTCTTTHPLTDTAVSVVKSSDPVSGQPVIAGQTLTYTLAVTVTNSATLSDVVLTDTLGAGLTFVGLGATNEGFTLGGTGNTRTFTLPAGQAPGTYSVSYTATVDATATTSVGNSVAATGGGDPGDPGAPPPTCTTCTTTHPLTDTAVSVVKSSDPVSGQPVIAGQTLTYTLAVTVTNSATLSDVVLTDTLGAGLTFVGLGATNEGFTLGGTGNTRTFTLPAGQAPGTYSVSYTATVDATATTSVGNSVAATGGGDPGDPGAPPPACTTCTTNHPLTDPSVTYSKSATLPAGQTTVAVNDTISYTLTVVVTNSQTTDAVVLTDTLGTGLTFGSVTSAGAFIPDVTGAPVLVFTLPANTLPGTYTVTYTAAVDASAFRSVTNAVLGTGGDNPSCTAAGGCSTETFITQNPEIELTKSASLSADNASITYSFRVRNSGNMELLNVNVSDPLLPGLSCATIPVFAIGATADLVCTGNVYTVQPADILAGVVVNTATAKGTPPGGGLSVTDDDTVTVPLAAPGPGITIAKSVTSAGPYTLGSTIDYAFLVTNTGNTVLENVVVTDPLPGLSAIDCPATTLAVGASMTCTATYVVTAADVAAGNVHNSATAEGTPPGEPPVTSPPGETDTPIQAPSLSIVKTVTSTGPYAAGSTISYQFVVTNTGTAKVTGVAVVDPLPGLSAISYDWPGVPGELEPGQSVTATATYVVTQADVDAGGVHNSATAEGTPPGQPPVTTPPSEVEVPIVRNPAIAVSKQAVLTTDNGTQGVGNVGDVITYTVRVTNTGNVTLTNISVMDSFQGGTPVALTCAPTTLAPGEEAVCDTYTHTITEAEVDAAQPLENTVVASGDADGAAGTITVTGNAEALVEIEPDPHAIRIAKTAGVREVNISDLVRYTLTVENVGNRALVNGSVVDTPPAGFTYVEGSLSVVDGDNAATVSGQSPLRFDGLDVAAGQTATLTYLMRVGAGVRPGNHRNQAQVYDSNGEPISNIATAEVELVADALLDDSLIFGTVFDDRDGDGWQDSAGLSGIKVQGGFAPGAYVPNSTTVDRGQGHQPQADASSPLLHGIAIGSIGGRQTAVDPAERQQVVVRQRLTELAFTNDFVLSNDQGVTVRIDAAGNTTVEKTGEAAKGLNSAEPMVERKVSAVEGGYVVDYVIRNYGFDERGIPGVRIASVEGLLIETDQFGRYHLAGVNGGNWARGRNFILKVDPSTLPAGAEFTTDNPLLRRVTPGLPVRFDWGVKLPVAPLEGKEQVEMELGEVIFAPGSAEVRAQYLPAIDAIAAKIEQYQGGDVVIQANGHTDTMALARAEAVKAALLERVSAQAASALVVSVRTDVGDPDSMVIGVDEGGYVLGLVLFDTDKSAIRPEFKPLLDRVAQVLDQRGEGVVTLIGHTDVRGSHAYNTALGMRRAKAVQEALAERLSPEVRARVRVDVRNEPTAPVGVKR